MQVVEQEHEIQPVAIGPVVPRGREEGNEVEPDRARLMRRDDQPVRRARRGVGLRRQSRGIVPPIACDGWNIGLGMDNRAVVAFQADRQRTGKFPVALGVKGNAIRRRGPDRDSPIAVIGHTDSLAGGGVGRVQFQARGQRSFGHGLGGIEGHRAGAARTLDERPVDRLAGIVLKRAILDQLGIKSAVVGVIDLFRHQSVKGGSEMPRHRRGVDDQHRLGQGP
jgi:hypothetical protein